ncbi:MAG TPA: sigma-70 family RNA polymerase sigma factor [Prolixibacteraceae bacterium]|nr:sigma-70 family RNA polymerase sigma factor [Prolixibacteraceae bacterium]HPS12469.1 sigma-70 family RNA polymerase sigma factor [Prolixibacteraceae bacterium]
MSATLKQLEFDRQLDLLQIREFRRTGDMEILGKIYYKYIHLVYGVCYKYLRNRAAAQDAVMQIFEKLTVEAIRQEIGHFKNWLYVVSKNYCLMELRKQNIEDERFRNWAEEEKKIMESGIEMHPLDEEVRMTEALQNCINKLKMEQKDCIDMFYFKKKSYRDIATILRSEEKDVKSNIQNGKRNLKICLERKHE